MEMPGIEPGAFHMQSERSTAELHPQFRNIQPYTLTYFHHTGSAWNAKLVFFGYQSGQVRSFLWRHHRWWHAPLTRDVTLGCNICLYMWVRLYQFMDHPNCTGSVAERSKALVLGTSQKWRGFESHRCQYTFWLLMFTWCRALQTVHSNILIQVIHRQCVY